MSQENRMEEMLSRMVILLERIAQDTKTTRENISKLSNAMVERAESEIPEYARRFGNWMHDLHDIRYMYEELGQPPPQHLLREVERCDDRFRQLLEKLHTTEGMGTGEFDKIRREMAADPRNRWDHTRQLTFGVKGENE